MSGLIDPKKTVEDGRRLGLIRPDYDSPTVTLPPIRPPPKSDGRTGKRPLRGAYHKKYVITPAELLAQHPNLKLP
jgi:hypothetical protein